MRSAETTKFTKSVAIAIQARMGSRRLPGKVLEMLAGKPVLRHVLDRVSQSLRADFVVVITSTEPNDDPIEAFCQRHGVHCFRGSHDNVAHRYVQALDHLGIDAFVRVCADSPLIDPALIDEGLAIFAGGRFDIVTNNQVRTFPAGQTVEILSAEALRRGFKDMQTPEHFEHVTRFFYENPGRFTIHNFTAPENCSDVNLTIDTRRDLDRLETLLGRFDRPSGKYGWRELVDDLCTASS